MCKLPLLHSQWFLNFQFSEIICYIIVVISASYECVQTVCLSILCVFLWHRQKTRNYHHVQSLRLLEDEQDSGAEYQLSNGLRQGCLVVFLASLYSTVVGICASHRFLSFSAVSPLSDISSAKHSSLKTNKKKKFLHPTFPGVDFIKVGGRA
jgi:hypothetical protein